MIRDILWGVEIPPICTETSTLAQECWVLLLSLLWGSRIKRKRAFWFICLFTLTKNPLAADSLPLVLLAELLNIKPQLVRKFPANKAVLWSQTDAPKNIRVNKLWMYHKQRSFSPLFPASSPGSCFRTRITKVRSSDEVLFRTHDVKVLATNWLVARLQPQLSWQPWTLLLQPEWAGFPGIPLMLRKYPRYPQLPWRNPS